MGTDIQVHTEIKVNGVWYHFGCPHIERHYRLFAKMGNVRNECLNEEPLAYVRHPVGRMNWTSEMTKLTAFFMQTDHVQYVYTLALPEICKLVQWYAAENFDDVWGLEGLFDFVDYNGWASIPNNDGIEDARFVFWFD